MKKKERIKELEKEVKRLKETLEVINLKLGVKYVLIKIE